MIGKIERPNGSPCKSNDLAHNSRIVYLFVIILRIKILCLDYNQRVVFKFGLPGKGNGCFGNYNPSYISVDLWDRLIISDDK